ncbi:MAG: response regulator [Clostridia bacterium]|nr:response regulator [Clostridia bacterium]
MYKLLIVDDEKTVRDRLKNTDWSRFEIGEVEVAEHGMAGLQKVHDFKPDFVLSDMHMPIMNGIEMIRKIHASFPWIQVVVLTGYDDFDYIRECMRSGVTDYILKPINDEELSKAFQKLMEAKKNEDQEKVRYQTLHSEKLEIIKGLRKRFLRHYFTEQMTEEEIEESSAYAEINLDADSYTTMVFRLDMEGKNAKEYYGTEFDLIVFALDNIMAEFLAENDSLCARIDTQNADCCVLVCRELNEEEAKALSESIKDNIYQIAELLGTTVSAAMGITVKEKTSILASLESARRVLSENQGRDAFYMASEDEETKPVEMEKRSEEKIIPQEESNMKLITRAAIEFIDKNFTKTITLDDVADHVYLSPTYVSFLFRTEVKMNFINYLTNKRMERAKELLKDPRLKIYEISTAVGYENSRYFSSIFKKYVGQTPIDYRSKLGVEEKV